MSEPFFVDTHGISRGMPGFRELADQVRSASEYLHGNLEALGDCWGDDSSGRHFAEQYLPAKDQMADGTRELYTVLESTADGIETMARGFTHTEQQNAEVARSLQPRVPAVPAVPATHYPETHAGNGSHHH